MKRNSFVFYKDWKEAIKDLPDEIRLEIYESIIEYATTGNIQELKPMASVAFNFIKTTIDRDIEKYVSIAERNRRNGMKGGRPINNPVNPVGSLETQSNPNNLDNDSVNDNDINSSSSNELHCETPSESHTETINYKDLVIWFNQVTKGIFGNIQNPLSDKRKSLIRARIREHGKNTFHYTILKACESDFLKGNSNSGFKATFDWIIRPTNFEKILSGNYDNKNKPSNGDNGFNETLARNVAEGLARADFEKQQRGT